MKKRSHPPLVYTVREVSELLRIHRPKVYDLIRDGVIDAFKLGADWRIRKESIEALVGPVPEDFFDRYFERKDGTEESEEEIPEKLQAE